MPLSIPLTRSFDHMGNDNVLIMLGMKLQKHLEPKAPNKVIDEMRTATGVKRTKTPMEENVWTPDLQLTLSPNEGAEEAGKPAKKRKDTSIAFSEKETDSDYKTPPLSLSLSLRGGDSGGEGSGGVDAGRLEAEIGSSSRKAALGLSTLDLTMSIKALE